MCGIAGTTGTTARDRAWVERALDRVAHRGPDARDVAEEADVTHGHVRLAILDLDARSDQPYRVPGGTLSYVGECWNYRELRADLERTGVPFRTDGDTEVVARVLERDGPDAAARALRGQYALAWTTRDGETTLLRDRLGEVPFYLLEQPGTLLAPAGAQWASERKAWDPPDAAYARAVPAGAVVRLTDRGAVTDRYYEPPAEYRPGTLAPADVLALLRASVTDRLRSDVPVAFLASGGLDSTLILALVRERARDVVAYRARVRGAPSPDWAAAGHACAALGVDLRDVEVDLDAESAERAVRAIETPMKAQVEIATLCLPLAERIRADGYRVVLSGEGADELFGGYGNLIRHSREGDAAWVRVRRESVRKQARANCVRTNKAFMAHAVEARLPFLDDRLVERVLPLGTDACPPGKLLLKAAARGLVPDVVVDRPKATFQGAAGAVALADARHRGLAVRAYNDVARRIFGGIPRDHDHHEEVVSVP